MNQVSKTKCENGHFFNLAKFDCCPICGGNAVGFEAPGKSAKSLQHSRKSVKNVDVTERLDDIDSSDTGKSGKAGRINWLGAQGGETEKGKENTSGQNQTDVRNDIEQQENRTSGTQGQTMGGGSLSQVVQSTGSGKISTLSKTVTYSDFPENTEPPVGWLVCTQGAHKGEAFTCFKGRNRIGRNPDNRIIPARDESITRKTHAVITYEPQGRKFYLENGEGDELAYINEAVLLFHDHRELHAYDRIRLGQAEFVFIPLCGEKFSWDDGNK